MWFNKYPYTDFTNLNLDWIISEIKDIYDLIAEWDAWKHEHEEEYNELKKIIEQIYNGDLTPALENAMWVWLKNNVNSIFSEWVKMVFFGLTDSGYFVAYIPDGWESITFKTTEYDYTTPLMPDYGHLVLQY